MAYVRDPNKSLRDNICLHLVDRFLGMQAGGPEGYTTTWNTVSRTGLSPAQIKDGNALCILDVEEKKVVGIGNQICHLTLITEFRYRRQEGDDPASEVNRLMSDVQRCMMSDQTCDGMALDVLERSNAVDIGSPTALDVGGYIAWHIEYRQSLNDPRRKVGEP